MEMNQMPVEMIEEILVSLPVKSLLRFKCVCKHWHDQIESRRFVDRHYCHDSNRDRLVFRRLSNKIEGESFEEEEFNGDGVNLNLRYFDKYEHRMGPVNGVFCEVGSCGTIVLLNPATREVKHLPSLPPLPRRRRILQDLRFGFGFGLDPSTGDYKTVAFDRGEFACVYSVSSDCWRFIEGVGVPSVGNLVFGGYCNGVCYWVFGRILAFDTITETFREIQPPPAVVDMENMYFYFGGGDESRVFFLCRRLWSLSDVWALEMINGNIYWSKIINNIYIPNHIMVPFCVWKNEVVCIGWSWKVGVWKDMCVELIAADICTHKVRQLLRLSPRDVTLLLTAFSYKDTLLSFKS